MQSQEVIQRFKEFGALLEGHFMLTSGLHSKVYLQCALVLQHPQVAAEFAESIAEPFKDQNIAAVVSPAIGGIVIGHEVARALGARFMWTERQDVTMVLRRGFSISPGEKVLVVEDVVTTGGSTRETVAVLQALGANVIGAASIIDRSAGEANVGVPSTALATLNVPVVDPAQCELCKRGEQATKPGSRKAIGSKP